MPNAAAAPKPASEPAPGSHEHNNRALAFELEKLRQACQIKDERIIELNALNFEQREDNLRMAFALEEARVQEQEAIQRYHSVVIELENMKKFMGRWMSDAMIHMLNHPGHQMMDYLRPGLINELTMWASRGSNGRAAGHRSSSVGPSREISLSTSMASHSQLNQSQSGASCSGNISVINSNQQQTYQQQAQPQASKRRSSVGKSRRSRRSSMMFVMGDRQMSLLQNGNGQTGDDVMPVTITASQEDETVRESVGSRYSTETSDEEDQLQNEAMTEDVEDEEDEETEEDEDEDEEDTEKENQVESGDDEEIMVVEQVQQADQAGLAAIEEEEEEEETEQEEEESDQEKTVNNSEMLSTTASRISLSVSRRVSVASVSLNTTSRSTTTVVDEDETTMVAGGSAGTTFTTAQENSSSPPNTTNANITNISTTDDETSLNMPKFNLRADDSATTAHPKLRQARKSYTRVNTIFKSRQANLMNMSVESMEPMPSPAIVATPTENEASKKGRKKKTPPGSLPVREYLGADEDEDEEEDTSHIKTQARRSRTGANKKATSKKPIVQESQEEQLDVEPAKNRTNIMPEPSRVLLPPRPSRGRPKSSQKNGLPPIPTTKPQNKRHVNFADERPSAPQPTEPKNPGPDVIDESISNEVTMTNSCASSPSSSSGSLSSSINSMANSSTASTTCNFKKLKLSPKEHDDSSAVPLSEGRRRKNPVSYKELGLNV